MACGKIRQKLFVFFTCIILIECRSVLELSGKQETNDGVGGNKSEHSMSDHEGFDESLADFKHLGDDPSVAVPISAYLLTGQLVSSSEAAWDAMSPKLRCGDDLMKLQLSGPEVAQIELCRVLIPFLCKSQVMAHLFPLPSCHLTVDTPFPLTEVLSMLHPMMDVVSCNRYCFFHYTYCKHCIRRTNLDVHVFQGGSYVMRIQWQGNSAVISCPMISTTANETFLGPLTPAYLQILLPHSPLDARSSAADTMLEPSTTETGEPSTPISQEILKPQPPGYSQAFLQRFWPYYYHHQHGKSEPPEKPITSVDQAPAQKPQLPGYPQDFWPYYYHHHGKPKPPEMPVPISIPTDTSVAQAPAQKPQLQGYPHDFWSYYYPYYYYYYYHHHHHGKTKPPEIPVPNSMPTTSVAQDPALKPQIPGYPQDFWPYYYPHHGNPKPPVIPVPTSMPTTSVAQEPAQKPQIPRYPQDFWPYYYPHHHGKPKPPEIPVPTSMPTTSVAKEPAQKPQIPRYPQDFWPYYYPHGKPKPPEIPDPTSMPTTSVAQEPAQKPQIPGYPQDFWPHYYPHHHGKPKPPVIPVPTSMPTTSVAQEPAQKPQIPGYPQDFWPYYYPHYHGKPKPPLYSQYPVQPPKTPTMPPITTTPQPCTTTAAAECIPSANQPPNYPPQYYIPLSSMFSEKDPIKLRFVDFSGIAADSFP
ncbi:hypothetical protein PO909_030451 [Leuciscus waleckii]